MTRKLPEYRWYHTNKGCAEHDNPECLCDVKIGTPAPILKERLVFGELALEAVGGRLTANNFDKFARTLLGCADKHHAVFTREKQEEPDPRANTEIGRGYVARSHGSKKTPWAKLSHEKRAAMIDAMKNNMPWAQARWILGDNFHVAHRADWLYIRKYYNINLTRYRKRNTCT